MAIGVRRRRKYYIGALSMWVYSIFSDALNKRRNKIHVSTLRELMYGTRFILTKITAM